MALSMISLLGLCVPLLGILMLGAGVAVYWNDPENKVIAGILAGIGLLTFVCTLVGVIFLFFGT
jgi:hypothetical protein